MTKEQMKVINDLRHEGYAIVIWTPDELEGASAKRLEERSIELGWDIISDLMP